MKRFLVQRWLLFLVTGELISERNCVMDADFDFANSPPPPSSATIFIPKKGKKHHCIVLGQFLGHWVHWIGKRSLPCYGSNCPAPRHKRPAQWRGYYPVAVWTPTPGAGAAGEWRSHVLALSEDNAHKLSPSLSTYPGPGLIVTRPGTDNKVEVEVKPLSEIPPGLPTPPDVKRTLAKVWGIRFDSSEDHRKKGDAT